MIDWLLQNQRNIVGGSRYIVAGCAFALLGIASLPRNALDRVIAIVGLAAIGLIFLGWLAIVILTVIHPRVFHRLRQLRQEAAKSDEH